MAVPAPAAVASPVRAPTLGRVAAVLALASASVHVLLLDAASLGSLVMVGMAAVCVPCARQLWRSPTGSVWGMTAALDAAMLALHAQMLSDPPKMHGMHPGESPSTLAWLGLALVTGQLLVAGAAALTSIRPRTSYEAGAGAGT